MVETIAPVVHGESRKRYVLTMSLHTVGAVLAAAAVGAVAGAVGLLLRAPWGTAGALVVVAAATIYALREALGLRVPVPDRHRQVPLWWRSFYSPPIAGFLYGVGLGVGYLTYLSFGTYFVVTIAAVASGDVLTGALLCAPFGLGRAASVALANRRTGPERPSGIDRIDDLAGTGWPKGINAAALVAVAVLALLAAA